jgi:hypothetical protein
MARIAHMTGAMDLISDFLFEFAFEPEGTSPLAARRSVPAAPSNGQKRQLLSRLGGLLWSRFYANLMTSLLTACQDRNGLGALEPSVARDLAVRVQDVCKEWQQKGACSCFAFSLVRGLPFIMLELMMTTL